jgi:hypothetical protein
VPCSIVCFHFNTSSPMPNAIITRLSRYFSNRRKNKGFPILPPPRSLKESPPSPSASSSGHSSSCSVAPTAAPSFIQIVCNDSQPVCSMETVPLYKPSPVPPGVRKEASLYDSAHREILKERTKGTIVQNEEQGRHSSHTSVHSVRSSSLYRQREYDRQQIVEEYAFGQPYGGPMYRDGGSRPMNPRDYYERDMRYPRQRETPIHQRPRSRIPVHSGPFKSQEGVPIRGQGAFLREDRYGRPGARSVPVDPFFIRESSIRQGPYHAFQYPNSPYDQCYHDDFRERPRRYYMDDFNEIPTTRVTRLREPRYVRDDGVKSDVGVGLGNISGMAASRSVSLRRNATTKTTRSEKAEIESHHRSPQRKVFPSRFDLYRYQSLSHRLLILKQIFLHVIRRCKGLILLKIPRKILK